MQVFVRACDLDFQITQAAHPAVDGRHLVRNHGGVRHQTDIGLEQRLVLFHPGGKRRGTYLFFTFEEEFDVVPELAAGKQVFEGLDVHEQLAFVIVCPASPDCILACGRIRADHRLEGISAPEFERLRGLHVVMPVNQYGLCLWINRLYAEDHRIAVCGEHLGLVGPGLHQQHGEFLRAAAHIVFVRSFCADRRNPQYGKQFFEEAFLVLLDIFFHKYRSK